MEAAVLLDIPDIRQSGESDCGPAVFRAVAKFHGIRGATVPDHSEQYGLSPDALETAFRVNGLRVLSGEMDIDILRAITNRGWPVVCLVTTEESVGHYVVIRGVERQSVFYHCPSDGRCKLRIEDFDARWYDRSRYKVEYVKYGCAVFKS